MATQYLFRSEASHVSALEEVFQVVTEVGDVGVHRDLRGEEGGKERREEESREKTKEGEEGPTLFSHSNSAHIFLNSASVHEAGWM